MKRIIMLAVVGLLLIGVVSGWTEAAEQQPTGEIEIIKDFSIPQLDRTRTIRIYLPPNYEKSNKRYPVLYMQDGEQLFNEEATHGGWKVDKSLDRLWRQGKTKGIIVVGIDSGYYRVDESAYLFGRWFWEHQSCFYAPQGKQYVQFLVNTLKPYIDNHYRTKPGRRYTGIVGSSMVAKISLYTVLDYPEVFSRAAGISGGFNPVALKGKIDVEKKEDMRVYLDMGTLERGDNKFSKRLVAREKANYRLLKKLGFKEEELKLVIDKGAQHNEKDWAKRFPAIVLWLFEDKQVDFKKYIPKAKVY